ncbi:ATP-dependent protease LonB [Syntrophobotulus glycolicus DSM 8271]|uniref:endopeptidase La n=1 Tax=Syntrophobotulus glycolicus (strain DSM 8271 / FlGlyR) TaxID=645991 RepID=F0SVY9_SYNGF|nr:ATP-dependent protease LonB [Syntrophobotulus glycolicus]ADY56773.1 ATP-dependent protease LonB [Syntrophobotulus glycolicus DSM 8271]
MNELAMLMMVVQFIFIIIVGAYFWFALKQQQGNKVSLEKEARKQRERLIKLRKISLSVPLSEKTRPGDLREIIGQKEGVKALKAAICGANPQHVLIYGPPGVGKTAVARLVLEEAKKSNLSPFAPDAKYIELDGATARFDERGIADPLIGSVHDPIYQGAGAMGVAGIPQPKMGAVSKAHGGVLFIDEIGELHSIQINKLLKVLEDRKVMLESSYYSSEDNNIPAHIHDIFQNGLPADFRLIGATTKSPAEIPPAIRSRCIEIFFRNLLPEEIGIVASKAAAKIEMRISDEALDIIQKYANNGREAVNIVQLAAGVAGNEGLNCLDRRIIEWVVTTGQYVPRLEKKIPDSPQVGVVNGLAVYGSNTGTLLELEVTAYAASSGKGDLFVTGIVEEEEQGSREGRKVRRKSMARSSVENAMTVLRKEFGVEPRNFDIHVNFPGGTPIDGPSAGVAMAAAVYSAITKLKADNTCAVTGELSIRGKVMPVGGVSAKIEAAIQAGCKRIFIPRENWQMKFEDMEDGVEVIPVDSLTEVLTAVLIPNTRVETVEVNLAEKNTSLHNLLKGIKMPV